MGCYECFGFFLAQLCSFTNVHEAPIDAANAPSRRPANGRSCCWRSRPPDLCWDWLTEQGEDQKTEGQGSLQYIPNIPNTANSLRALSQETPISLGSSPEGLGAGQQDGGRVDTRRMIDWNCSLKGRRDQGICFCWVKMCHLLSDFSIWILF